MKKSDNVITKFDSSELTQGIIWLVLLINLQLADDKVSMLTHWEHVAQLDSRSEYLGFDSQCWPSVEVSGKLCIPLCPCPPSHNGYLVHRYKVGSIAAGCTGAHLARGKVKSVEHALSWSLDSEQLSLPLHFHNNL